MSFIFDTISGISTGISTVLKFFNLDGYDISNQPYAGVATRPMIGMPNPFSLGGYDIKMSGTDIQMKPEQITTEEKKAVQVLQNYSNQVSKEDVLRLVSSILDINYMWSHIPVMNMASNDIKLVMKTSFCFDGTVDTSNKYINGAKVIGRNDHAYIQLIPRNFINYAKLMQYKYCYLKSATIKSEQNSSSGSSQNFAFYSIPQDTRKWTNEQVFSAAYHSEKKINENLEYLATYFSPTIMSKLETGEFQGDVTRSTPQLQVSPNFVMKNYALDYLEGDGTTDKPFLSYGTCCFTATNKEGQAFFDVTVEMIFEAFNDQAIVASKPGDGEYGDEGEDSEDGDGDGEGDGTNPGGDGSNPDGDGSGSAPPTATRKPAASKLKRKRSQK